MQSLSPIILSLNLFDPSHRSGFPAESLDIVRAGCQPLSVVTALSVQDSYQIEQIIPVDATTINDQARCLLEDITPSLIKITALTNPESCAIAAQILSDYEQIPSVILLNPPPILEALDSTDDSDEDLTLSALLNLVAPLAGYVIIEATQLSQWLPEHESLEELLDNLFDQNVQCCIVLANKDNHGPENLIYTNQGGEIYLPDLPKHVNAAEYSEAFATAFSCALSQGLAAPKAAQQAISSCNAQFEAGNQMHIGMGRSVPRRYISPAIREQ